VIPPGIRHDYGTERTAGRWAFFYAHFHPRPEWLALLDWPEAAPGILGLWLDPGVELRVRNCLERAARFRLSSPPRPELMAANALEEALLWWDTQNPRQGRRLDEPIMRALELVDRRLPGPVGIEEMANAATLSPSRFSHLVRQQLGMAPGRYVERQRMLAAAQLLELTQRPVASVAAQVGFDDPLYFSSRFHKVMGVSPSGHRARAMSRTRPKPCEDDMPHPVRGSGDL